MYIILTGPTISEKIYPTTTHLRPKPKQRNVELNKYYSTFLKDLASHKSDLSRHLDTILYRKKRHLIDHNEQPNKVRKLSRRQKKRLKNQENHPATRKKDTRSQTTVIERTDLFYCANSLNSEKDKLSLRLPKERE
jgi:LPS O-antigen subunit length determinant protein (WzzB/FepE family)